MTYTDTLTRSWGFIIAVASSLIILVATFLHVAKWNLVGGTPRKIHELPGKIYLAALLLTILFLGAAGYIGGGAMQGAGKSGAEGNPVSALRYAGILFFDVRAIPVEQINTVTEPPVAIPYRGLIFLGNNDRSFVLYCTTDRQILKISMERFTLRTSTSKSTESPSVENCDEQ
ncbi:hypothetical protein ACLQ2E_07800 [Streptomyces lavendulocolor]